MTTTFALIAEAGPLEHQALLLVDSIRRFAGRYASAPIIVVSPRPGRRPSTATQRAFNASGATYLELDVKSVAPEYGTSWRMHASARIEAMCAGTLVVLDSDVVIVSEPQLELPRGVSAAARPVDVKGMCTSGANDPNDAYWRSLCKVTGSDYDRLPTITTTVDRAEVKASYNGGFLVVRAADRLLSNTESFFARSVEAGLLPHGVGAELETGHGTVTGPGARFWGSSQACFSLAAWSRDKSIQLLPATHNFPLNHDSHVFSHGMAEPLVALHYHQLFGPGGRHTIHRRLNLQPHCREWLEQRLPLAVSEQ